MKHLSLMLLFLLTFSTLSPACVVRSTRGHSGYHCHGRGCGHKHHHGHRHGHRHRHERGVIILR